MAGTEFTRHSYQRVAWIYQALAGMFSWGNIRKVKASQIRYLEPGDRVLYPGAGSGEDAVLAARAGARVTVLDLAPAMVERTRRAFARARVDGEFVVGDFMEHQPVEPYDAVAANFFLNVFPEPLMPTVLARVAHIVRPGGKVLIGDVAPPEGGRIARAFQHVYAFLGNIGFWAIGLAPRAGPLDYPKYLDGAGLDLVAIHDFRLLPFAPPSYRSYVTRKR